MPPRPALRRHRCFCFNEAAAIQLRMHKAMIQCARIAFGASMRPQRFSCGCSQDCVNYIPEVAELQ